LSFSFPPLDYRVNYRSDGFRIQYVFLFQNSSRKCFDRIVVEDRDGALGDDWAAVERVVDEVDRASADLCAMIECLSLRVQTGEQRQQAWVDVDDALRKRVHEKRRQDAHVTGETNQIDAFLAQDRNNLAIVFFTFTPATFDDECFETALLGGEGPFASDRSLITKAISAFGIVPFWIALASAIMFDPRPEIKIAIRVVISRS
jgi:hypothetical protein